MPRSAPHVFPETPLRGGPGFFRLNVSGQSATSAPGFVGLRFQRVTPFGEMAIFANFDGEFSGVNQLYAGKGGFRYVW